MNYSIFFNQKKYQLYQEVANYKALMSQIEATIQKIPDLYTILFKGPGNLHMTINSQEDLEALFHLGNNYKIVNLEIKDLNEDIFNMAIEEPKVDMEKEEEKLREEAGPMGLICDGCQIGPIVGIRYSCLDCINFNLCGKCQQIIEHEHNLLKVKHPNQFSSPIKNNKEGSIPDHNPPPIRNYPVFPGNTGIILLPPNQPKAFPISSFQPSIFNPYAAQYTDKTMLQNASLIVDLFNVEYEKAIIFVKQNPGLSQQQLVALALKRRGY